MDVVGEFWFSVRQGEALTKTFTFTEDGAPLALTDPYMQGARRNAASDRIDFSPAITNGNVVTITMTSEDTLGMTPGDYLWDLFATGPDEQVLERLQGVFEVVESRSRPVAP